MSDVTSESLKITAATAALAAVLAAAFIFGGRMLLRPPVASMAASEAADPPLGAQYRDRRVSVPAVEETSPPPFVPPALPSFDAELDAGPVRPDVPEVDEPAAGADDSVAAPSPPFPDTAPSSVPPASARPVPSVAAAGAERMSEDEPRNTPDFAGTEVNPPAVAALGTGPGRPVTLSPSEPMARQRRSAASGAQHAVAGLSPDRSGGPDTAPHGDTAGELHQQVTAAAQAEAMATPAFDHEAESLRSNGETSAPWSRAWPRQRTTVAKPYVELPQDDRHAGKPAAAALRDGVTPAPSGTASPEAAPRETSKAATAASGKADPHPTSEPTRQKVPRATEQPREAQDARPSEPAPTRTDVQAATNPRSDEATTRPSTASKAQKAAAPPAARAKSPPKAPAKLSKVKSDGHKATTVRKSRRDAEVMAKPSPPSRSDKGKGNGGKKSKRP